LSRLKMRDLPDAGARPDPQAPSRKEKMMIHREIAGNPSRQRLLARLPVRELTLELAGISTAALEGGEGPPVVLLHGPGAHSLAWLRVLPRLVRAHRVIVPDLPAHGASAQCDGELDTSRLIGWVAELVERTCETTPAFVGHLMGGSIAAHFAAEYPQKVRKLVLVNTMGLTEFAPTPAFGAAITGFFTEPSRASHERLWQHCAHDLGGLKREMAELWRDFEDYNVETASSPALVQCVPKLLELFARTPLAPALLQSIAAPTMLVWGRHDRATPLSVAEAASKRYGWPLHIIENANDDPVVEQPDALVLALRHLLSEES
jgi:pimeloyl-ACP methyl ester carboxylesterase